MATFNEVAPQSAEEQNFMQGLMKDQGFIEKMQGLPPEEQAALARQMYQDYQGQGDINAQAMSQADALRNQPMREGVTAGDQFHAASPMSGIAKGINTYRGNRDYNAAQAKQQALSDDRSAGQQSIAQMLMSKLRGAPSEGEGSLNAAKSYSDALRNQG